MTTQHVEAPIKKSPRMQHFFRGLISFTAAGTLGSNTLFETPNYPIIGLIIALLLYAACAFFYIRRLKPDQADKFNRILFAVDAGILGFVLNLTEYQVLACIMFFAMIQFNAIMTGGLRQALENNATFAIGMLLSFAIAPPTAYFTNQLMVSGASLIGAATYFLAYAIYIRQEASFAKAQTKLLEEEHTQLKMRAYKLSRYLPPTVWQAINRGDDKHLQAERKRITIFFSDIKDFSQLSEEIEAETLTDILNHYLSEMSRIVHHYGGTIDKFMGDGMMILFGDSASRGVKDDATRCVSMALAMKKRIKALELEWYNQGIKQPIQVRMGINTGYCTVGTFGTANHLDYTVLGTQVNLASRLESAANPDEILISHETWSLVKDTVMCRDKGEITVKGFAQPIKVYQVADLRKDAGKNQNYFEDRADGFSMYLDVEKIRNYDKQKVLESLDKAAARLRDKVIV